MEGGCGEGREREKRRGEGRRNGVRGVAPAKFLKTRFYPVSRPRGAFSFAFLDSSHRDLPLGEVRTIIGRLEAPIRRSAPSPPKAPPGGRVKCAVSIFFLKSIFFSYGIVEGRQEAIALAPRGRSCTRSAQSSKSHKKQFPNTVLPNQMLGQEN